MDQYIFADNLCRLCRKMTSAWNSWLKRLENLPARSTIIGTGNAETFLVTLSLIAEALIEANKKRYALTGSLFQPAKVVSFFLYKPADMVVMPEGLSDLIAIVKNTNCLVSIFQGSTH